MLKIFLSIYCIVSITACSSNNKQAAKSTEDSTFYAKDSLPNILASQSAKNFSKVIGWKDGQTPIAPKGFTVSRFADKLDNPRWIYVADNGGIFLQSLIQSYFFCRLK